MEKMNTQELMSALADGQLQGEELARGLALVTSDPVALEAWQAYHLVGDVLRSGELAGGTAPQAFLARLQESLREEQALGAAAVRPILVLPAPQPAHAANDPSQRWKLVAGFASVAAVAAIGWTALGTGTKADGPQLAASPSAGQGVVLTATERGTMLRDARLDQLMQAHRQFGGTTALQSSAGFLRNATFEGSAR